MPQKLVVRNECDKCQRGKQRIATLLRNNPNYQNVIIDDESSDKNGNPEAVFKAEKISEFLPEKDYWPDIFCERTYPWTDIGGITAYKHPLIIEVDHHSHLSAMSTIKDKRRDKHFLSKGIPTVRFPLQIVVGRAQWSDTDILDTIEKEIEYQLR